MRAEDVAEGDALRRLLQRQLRMRGITDEAVLQAMARVPRHLFVPRETLEDAYADQPLPIGYGQTISQPYIVAVMSMLLDLTKESRVLEIGTGCGYQTAILAELAGEVQRGDCRRAVQAGQGPPGRAGGMRACSSRLGDGYYGWAEHAPYDAILATCAPSKCRRLSRPSCVTVGALVILVGSQGDYQVLLPAAPSGGQGDHAANL